MLSDTFYLMIGILLGLAILFLWLSLRALLKKRFLNTALHSLLCALLVAILMVIGLLITNFYTYQRLTVEQTVAEIRFEALGEQRFRAFLYQPDKNLTEPYLLLGNEFQLDARIIKWKGLAVLLGMNSAYRLERLSGRYQSSSDEIHQPRSVFDLHFEKGLSIIKLAKQTQGYLDWVDTYHGNASFMPMADGAHYIINLTNTGGLVARPANSITAKLIQNWE